MTAEFNLIKKHFTRNTAHTGLSIGDDAALIHSPTDHELAISTDMSVANTHFFEDAAPYDIGWKSLAVNISDMAAMGAKPKWATLAIALPNIDDTWLSEFSRGFFACAAQFEVDLIGGDTTRGPLNIAVQIIGEVPMGKALKRSSAQIGDDIWVSGHLGSAAVGLSHLQQNQVIEDEATLQICLNALNSPQPRAKLGIKLLGLVHSCIDISDGLLADLSHILKASDAGANIKLESIPCLPLLKKRLNEKTMQQAVLTGGDDYELCFTAAANKSEAINEVAKALNLNVTKVGKINASSSLLVTHDKKTLNLGQLGYEHFSY